MSGDALIVTRCNMLPPQYYQCYPQSTEASLVNQYFNHKHQNQHSVKPVFCVLELVNNSTDIIQLYPAVESSICKSENITVAIQFTHCCIMTPHNLSTMRKLFHKTNKSNLTLKYNSSQYMSAKVFWAFLTLKIHSYNILYPKISKSTNITKTTKGSINSEVGNKTDFKSDISLKLTGVEYSDKNYHQYFLRK